MKKQILSIGLITALSTSLLGFTYEIKDGWQQLGAIEVIEDMTIFNNAGCIDHVWYYDNNDTSNPQWRLHIADGNTYNYCGETLDSLKKGQGFWVKATGNCTIEIDEPNCNPLGMPIPPSPDSCDANVTNPDINGTIGTIATGLPAPLEVISSNVHSTSNNVHSGPKAISNIIVNDKETFKVTSNNTTNSNYYAHGYFYDENSNAIIKVNESFKLWTTISDLYPTYRGQLKITNIDTNQTILSNEYPVNPVPIKTYYEMTDILPAGTYKFEIILPNSRIDDGWFFEKYE